MTYLLDTNTCIKYLNGKSENIRQRLEALQP
jgi:predicted nucleic acid-binding protein